MKASEQRQAVLEMCQDFADARQTGNPRVINAVAVDIQMVRLPKLLPDRPTMEEVCQALK